MNRAMVLCVLLAIVLAGCAPSQHVSKPRAARPSKSTTSTAATVSLKTWHIAGFTVKEIPLPSDYKPNELREFVEGTTLLKMAAVPPYTVTWQSLTSKKTGTIIENACPHDTLSAYADIADGFGLHGGYPSTYAGFVCVGRERSLIDLVYIPDMKVSVFALPGYSKSVQEEYGEYRLSAGIYGTAAHPYLAWTVGISESSDANLGSGVFDMTTGQAVRSLPKTPPIPPGAFTLTAPDGTLYSFQGHEVSRWDGTAFEPLGTIPDDRVYAVDQSGVVWADQPSSVPDTPSLSYTPSDTIVRETPGSAKITSWKLVGMNFMLRPGFVAYTPGYNLDGPVDIFFPAVDRTLSIDNVWGQPFPAAFPMANDQIMITTWDPPVVIEVIPPR